MLILTNKKDSISAVQFNNLRNQEKNTQNYQKEGSDKDQNRDKIEQKTTGKTKQKH